VDTAKAERKNNLRTHSKDTRPIKLQLMHATYHATVLFVITR